MSSGPVSAEYFMAGKPFGFHSSLQPLSDSLNCTGEEHEACNPEQASLMSRSIPVQVLDGIKIQPKYFKQDGI